MIYLSIFSTPPAPPCLKFMTQKIKVWKLLVTALKNIRTLCKVTEKLNQKSFTHFERTMRASYSDFYAKLNLVWHEYFSEIPYIYI